MNAANDTTNEIIVASDTPSALAQAGQAANSAASQNVFADFRARRSENTLRAQDSDLANFTTFLNGLHETVALSGALNHDPGAWRGITYGLIEAFVQAMITNGYALTSVNRALSTVKKYAGMAFKAGAIEMTEHALIRTVTGYATKEQKRVNEKRESSGMETRIGEKKAEHTRLSVADARALKRDHDDTPQGRRDAVLMSLLLDLGLRCGEVALLTVDTVNFSEKTITFYRPKVDKTQTHNLTPDLFKALKAYADAGDMLPAGKLLRASRKSGQLTHGGMTNNAIMRRVRALGESIGVDHLSPHDCRHFWATDAARQKTDPFRLQEAGGWNSLAMPRRYVEDAKIANEGVMLST
jgi:integrase